MPDQPAIENQAAPGIALSDEAIDWLVLIRSGRATKADNAAFATWRRTSPAHDAAAREAEALWRDIATTPAALQALAHARIGEAAEGRRLSRRMVLGGAAAAAASVALLLAGSGALGPVQGLFSDDATRLGERRKLRLADGSTVVLNTATALSTRFTTGERRLVLHAGEAYFDVAPDPARPFVVSTANGEVRALGTAFALRHDAGLVRVIVSEGTVALRPKGDKGEAASVRAGHEAVLQANGASPAMPIDATTATAWLRGKYIFNRRRLTDVVAEFERYRAGRIVIANRELETMEVSGVADLDDITAALRALEQTIGARIVQLPLLTLIL